MEWSFSRRSICFVTLLLGNIETEVTTFAEVEYNLTTTRASYDCIDLVLKSFNHEIVINWNTSCVKKGMLLSKSTHFISKNVSIHYSYLRELNVFHIILLTTYGFHCGSYHTLQGIQTHTQEGRSEQPSTNPEPYSYLCVDKRI
ncbi:hypothetical protein [Escherichia phage PGN6866]|nr:hypothetical protein [Escherichia phage PGN6866]